MCLRRLALAALCLSGLAAFCLCLDSCDRPDNAAYIDYLAALVIRYQERHGSPPDSFGVAHHESGVTLPNRGDVYGGRLSYIKCGERGFMFRAYGENGEDNLGMGDDLDLYYLDGHRVPRDGFIRYLKTINQGIFWRTYRDMFEEG